MRKHHQIEKLQRLGKETQDFLPSYSWPLCLYHQETSALDLHKSTIQEIQFKQKKCLLKYMLCNLYGQRFGQDTLKSIYIRYILRNVSKIEILLRRDTCAKITYQVHHLDKYKIQDLSRCKYTYLDTIYSIQIQTTVFRYRIQHLDTEYSIQIQNTASRYSKQIQHTIARYKLQNNIQTQYTEYKY